MNPPTLESLAERVAALERAIENKPLPNGETGWQSVLGMFAGSDFMHQVDAEGRALREAERRQ